MADHEENAGEGDKEYVPEDNYTPVVTLPEAQVETLEENEEVLGKVRAKLYRFGAGKEGVLEWRERGVGEAKFLKDKANSHIRVLMRREQTLKICLNHFVHPSYKLAPNIGSDKSWVWVAQDYADGELKTEKLAIRFNTVEHAKEFKDLFESAQASNAAALKATKGEGEVDEESKKAEEQAEEKTEKTEKTEEPKAD